jgi:hypothetical protein
MIFSSYRDLSLIYFGRVKSKHFPEIFNDLVDRAVSLINLNEDALDSLEEKRFKVEGMLYSLFPEFQIVGEDEDGGPIYGEPEDEKHISFAKKLYLNINELTLDSDDTFSWPQYFGLLALMIIDYYVLTNDWFYEELESPPPHIPNWESTITTSRAYALIDATEAVSFGETLTQENLPTQGLLKDKISKQAQKAISKRYQPLNNLKNSFIQFYFDSSDKSNKSELARKFYRNLPEQQQKIISSTLSIENARRTLTNHLNKVLNHMPFNPYS